MDPDSQSPPKVLQKKRVSIVPPAGSPDPDFAPSPDAEVQRDGGLDGRDGPGGEEEEEEGGADRAFTKLTSPQLDLRRGEDNTLIQNLNVWSTLNLIKLMLNPF